MNSLVKAMTSDKSLKLSDGHNAQEFKMAEVTNVVNMKDGRQVDFGKRGKQKSDYEISGEGKKRQVKVRFDIPNGDTHNITVGFDHPLVCELIGYGLKQKVADSLANADDPDDISLAVEKSINQLNEGKWSVRTGTDSGLPRGFADLYQAYLEIRGITDEDGTHKRRLMEADETLLKQIKNHAAIKAVLARIAAEKAAAKAQKLNATAPADDDLPDF